MNRGHVLLQWFGRNAVLSGLCAGALMVIAAEPSAAQGRRESDTPSPRAAAAREAPASASASAPAPAPAPSRSQPSGGSASSSRGSGSRQGGSDDAIAVPRSPGSGSVDDRRGDARGDSRSRGYSGGGYGQHYGGSRHYPSRYWGYYSPYDPWWGPRIVWWFGGPYPYFYYSDHYYRGAGGGSGGDAGALDLDVSPEKAEIWVDGKYVGIADQYDGFPRYLWLPAGTYDVVIFQEGYETIARQYTIYPGRIIDVEDRMRPGVSTRPEDLASKSTVHRDQRLRRDDERAREAADWEQRRSSDDWRTREADEDSWRRREAREEGADEDDSRSRREDRETTSMSGAAISLRVEPGDASVYLDGQFLGTADDLARLPRGIALDAGRHILEVVRPGYESSRREFDLRPGETVELELRLTGE